MDADETDVAIPRGAHVDLPMSDLKSYVYRLFLMVPILVILLNIQISTWETAAQIATTKYSSYSDHTSVMVDTPDTVSVPFGTDANYFQANQGEVRCTQGFIDAYNNGSIVDYNEASCGGGRLVQGLYITCNVYEHPAYLALVVAWFGWALIAVLVQAGYIWFPYSIYDMRYYIAVEKFKTSIRNRIIIFTGVLLTFVNVLLALYYGFYTEEEEVTYYASDTVSLLMGISVMLGINMMSLIKLGGNQYINVHHISLSEDLPNPIPTTPTPDCKKAWYNLYGCYRDSASYFKDLDIALLRSKLYDDKTLYMEYVREEDEAYVEELIKKMHQHEKLDIEKFKEELLRDIPDANEKTLSEQMAIYREKTYTKSGSGTDAFRRLFLLLPLILICINSLNFAFKTAENYYMVRYDDYDKTSEGYVIKYAIPTVDNAQYTCSKAQSSVNGGWLQDFVYPGDLTSADLNDCNSLDEKMVCQPIHSMGCDESYPIGVHRVTITCEYDDSPVFIVYATTWLLWFAVLMSLAHYYSRHYFTNDLRYYLAVESSKQYGIFEYLINTAFLLSFALAVTGIAVEGASDYPRWEFILGSLLYFYVSIKLVSELTDDTYTECALIDFERDFKKPIPIAVMAKDEFTLKNFYGIRLKTYEQVFQGIEQAALRTILLKDDIHIEMFGEKELLMDALKKMHPYSYEQSMKVKSGITSDDLTVTDALVGKL